MNEILQQRIESVRAGKNITHAQIEAKRSLREQLERGVEAFLKMVESWRLYLKAFRMNAAKGGMAQNQNLKRLCVK